MRRVLFLAASIVLAVPVQAAAEWRALHTHHFQVIGDVSVSRLRDVALRFEQFREVVAQLLPSAVRAGSAPMVVIVFPDERSYRPFMPIANGRTVPVSGFFVDGADVNYITINLEAGDRAFPTVFHEFSHFLLSNVFAHAPVWFNEGLGEYFSTFEMTNNGTRALVGKPVSRHIALLRDRRLKLAELFAIDRASSAYTREGIERDLLYAQSWALVHYARHGATAGGQGGERRGLARPELLARRLADGEDAHDSVRAAYAVSLERLDAEVQAYVRKQIYEHVELHSADSVTTRVDAITTTLDAAEVDSWLADLLAHLQRGPEAIPRLERALGSRTELPRALATLGVLRIRQGNRDEGLSLLERAAAAGPDIESVQFEYGWALATQGVLDAARADRAQTALARALAIQPDYPAAIQMLASVYGQTGRFAEMRDLLTPLVKAVPDNQDASLQLAAALLGLGDSQSARALAGPVLARPRDEELRVRARTLLGQLSKLQQP